jgi:hypothetical protein
MKRKSVIIMFVVAIALAFTAVPAKSFAEINAGWHDVTIDYGGPFFDQVLIRVNSTPTNPQAFVGQWLKLNPSTQNQLLATALSAISMGSPVTIWVYAYDQQPTGGFEAQRCDVLWLKAE